jgi:hypothetical protein
MAKLDIVKVAESNRTALPTTSKRSTPSQLTCRIEHLPVTEQRNILGCGLPLYQQHIELTPRPLTDIRIATTGLTSAPVHGSFSEVEITFQRGDFSGQVTHALGGTRIRIASAGNDETIRLGEALILAGQNLLRLVEHATSASQPEIEAKLTMEAPMAD